MTHDKQIGIWRVQITTSPQKIDIYNTNNIHIKGTYYLHTGEILFEQVKNIHKLPKRVIAYIKTTIRTLCDATK